jgi:hypothetical protein
MLEKIFTWSKKHRDESEGEEEPPRIQFGRYSDNNKPVEKVARWNEADTLFKEKKWHQSIQAFFDYLHDAETGNVQHVASGTSGTFQLFQGSKIIKGFYNEHVLQAEVALATMVQPSVPVMRRLLEMNFTLYYTRYALHNDNLVMLFDSSIETANPSKLYYGLKELATKADKHDDLLVQDFASLITIDTEHVEEIPKWEKELKFRYFKKWIRETLDLVASVEADKYSGGIAYLLLALAYRIDFLIVPEGKLLLALEKVVDIYFRKDDRPVAEKNGEMLEEFQKLLDKKEDEFFPNLFRSRYTFSIVTPQNYKTIADAIYNANQNIAWYKEAKHPEIAAQISEYGIAYCQYSYSLPRPVTELFHLFMMVNYPDYFEALGYKMAYYNRETKEFHKEGITAAIEAIEQRWQLKYPELKIKKEKLRFDSMLAFNQTLTSEIEYLNLETR